VLSTAPLPRRTVASSTSSLGASSVSSGMQSFAVQAPALEAFGGGSAALLLLDDEQDRAQEGSAALPIAADRAEHTVHGDSSRSCRQAT
jgi:hypothetical protein